MEMRRKKLVKARKVLSIASILLVTACLVGTACLSHAAQLSTDARSTVPREVQQLIVIDYRAMQNSTAAMELRDRVMPPELKQLQDSLEKSGLNDNHDVDQLAFALFRSSNSDTLETLGIAQGQFPMADILASFRKQSIKATKLRNNSIYPLTKAGMVLCFVDASTIVFGDKAAVTSALDARDGMAPNLLSNGAVMSAMQSVDTEPLWSTLDAKGTQTMMRQLLGEAGSMTDFDTVKQRLQSSWYSMNFQHGVKFDLTISTGDTFTAATISSLMSAAMMVRKMSSTDAEKQALNATSIASDSGRLSIHFAASDAEFGSLLQSPLFQSVVR
jgi:hypothetical protein